MASPFTTKRACVSGGELESEELDEELAESEEELEPPPQPAATRTQAIAARIAVSNRLLGMKPPIPVEEYRLHEHLDVSRSKPLI
jgi:hypothetical protein